jgi:hypothetical protein
LFFHIPITRIPEDAMNNTEKESIKEGDNVDTKLGIVKVLERRNGKIMVLIDGDITATFDEKEFFNEFVL